MNEKLKQAELHKDSFFQAAIEAEEIRQDRIALFVDELLGGKPISCWIRTQKVQLTYSDVEEQMNEMLGSGALEGKIAGINLIRYHFGDAGKDESLLDYYKSNVSLAAHTLISKHYESIIEEAAIDSYA